MKLPRRGGTLQTLLDATKGCLKGVGGCGLSLEVENTRWLFSVSINTRGVARAPVVFLQTRVAGVFGVFQLEV